PCPAIPFISPFSRFAWLPWPARRRGRTSSSHPLMHRSLPYPFALLAALSALPAMSSATRPLAAPDLVFAEEGGRVAFEAEHFFQQELTNVRAWYLTSSARIPTLQPDSDPPHAIGASGGA